MTQILLSNANCKFISKYNIVPKTVEPLLRDRFI